MFFPEGVKSSQHRVLHITEHGIDPLEYRVFPTHSSTTRNHWIVNTASIRYRVKAGQTVGPNSAVGSQGSFRISCDLLLSKPFNSAQLHNDGFSVFCRFNCCDEGNFIGRSAPAFARFFTTNVSIVNFNPTRQLLALLMFQHDLHQLVLHHPGGVVAHPDIATQLHRRHTGLVLGQQINCQEPLTQWQIGVLKNRAGGQRRLVMAFMALIKFTALEFAVCGIATIGTDKASRPTQLEQRGPALFLCTVGFEEFLQTQALLELDSIT